MVNLRSNPTVFADTSFFIALTSSRDRWHEKAQHQFRLKRPNLTTEFILLELGDFFSRGPERRDVIKLLSSIRVSPRIEILPLSSHYLQAGLELLADRPDKEWSLTDCISFVIMQERGLTDALTADRHFEQAGFRALLA